MKPSEISQKRTFTSLHAKRDLLHLHGRLSGYDKNKFQSRFLTDL